MKLFVALMTTLFSVSAHADMYAIAPNQIGGHTILSQKPCNSNPKWKSAYAFSRTNSVSFACWYLEKNNVIFVTESGTIRSMSLKSFEVIVENR
jgi:hypothetical protein